MYFYAIQNKNNRVPILIKVEYALKNEDFAFIYLNINFKIV